VKYFSPLCLFLLCFWGVFPASLLSEEEKPGSISIKKTIEEERLDTIRYGTETEIVALIKTLRDEKDYYLNDELAQLMETTRNRNILSGVFSFFGEQNQTGLEERAIRVINERDYEANETVLAAVNYLGTVKSPDGAGSLKTLINEGESRFMGAAFRALGQIGGALTKTDREAGDGVADYLIHYYLNRSPPDENRRDIIISLGETGSFEGVSFLAELAANEEERAVLRMAALEALAKIGDIRGLDAILAAVSSEDPNVRSTAVSALGPFSGKQVENTILESFRDSYYRTRIGAAQAARERKLTEAVPYLRYRAERDEVPAVKDEAIRALGAIANQEAVAALDSLFEERKNPDRVRILAAEMLIQSNADIYVSRTITALDEAKGSNQSSLYNGLLRVLGEAKAAALEDLARRFFAAGGVIEKSYALDITAHNQFHNLAGEVRSLINSKTGNLSQKALATLKKMGLDDE
jgi:HEAT repeat protein